MTERRTIALLMQGSFSHINASVEAVLRREFPGHPLEVVDVAGEFLSRRSIRLFNRLQVWRHHAAALLAGRRTYWDCFYQTPWMAQAIRNWSDQRLRSSGQVPWFTFQTQSLFDAGLAGVPHFIYTDHTHLANLSYPAFDRRKLFPPDWITTERSFYQRARRVFTMSHHVERSVREDYGCGPEQVRCVYAGSNAPTAPFTDDLARYQAKRILFNGVDWERKGGPELAAAFPLVLKKHPDARLVVVGCSPDLGLPNCEVLGRVPLEEVPRNYAAASVFCLPTRIEPFGIAFVEAMQHRLPIVATRIGALPDMVTDGENGWLVNPGEPAALAGALVRLLDDPAMGVRLGGASLERAKERYNWEAVGKRLAGAIREVCE